MRSFFITTFFLGALGIAYAQTMSTNWSNQIISKKKHPLTYWISHGGNVVNILIIDGKRFEHVRGLEKFYLPVPKTNAIVFVVDNKDYSVTYHIYKMDTKDDVAINAKSSVFGHTIGCVNVYDTVERADDGKIVLCNHEGGAKSTLPSLANLDSVKTLYYLDLDKKTIVAEKTFYYDKGGKVILQRDASPPF